jgi:hypothetical protein
VNSELGAAWLQQIAWCDKAGSPFTARVLEAAWNDWLAGGALRELMPDWPGDPWADAPPLRVAGALHSLALEGADPALEAIYPPRRIAFDPVAGTEAVRNALRVHRERVAEYLCRPPQTNEIGRSAVLLGGFAMIAARTRLPLALREIGASAGLNLLWHRYRYELGGSITWGDPASPVTVRSNWQDHPPALPARIDLASWRGCDKTPIDLTAPHAAARLAGYVWPDQRERVERVQAAIALAKSENVNVEQADAATFLTRELAAMRSGEATVVYHSIVWQYLSEETRSALDRIIGVAGARATVEAPLAWLALEPPDPKSRPLLVLTLWPGGDRTVLAEAVPHGQSVHWYAQTTPTG